jgi:hypothetical protein
MDIKIKFRDLDKSVSPKAFKSVRLIPLRVFLAEDIVLDAHQDSFVNFATKNCLERTKGFDTLSGKGGVGKTTVIKKLVQKLLAAGAKILILAPTHAALNILRNKIPVRTPMLRFETVAKATKAQRSLSHQTGELSFYANNLEIGDETAVILDEGSFLDDREIKGLLTGAVTSGVRLIVCGDACQLPKPKSTTISMLMEKRAIVGKKGCSFTELTKVYRTEGLGILSLSDYIRYQWVIPERRGLTFNTVLNAVVEHSQVFPKEVSIYYKTEKNMRYIHELIARKNGNVVYIAYTNKTVDDAARYNLERQYRLGQTDHPNYPQGSLWTTKAPLIIGDVVLMNNGEQLFIDRVHETKLVEYYGYDLLICELAITKVADRQKLFVDAIHPDSKDDYQAILDGFDVDAKQTENKVERRKIWVQKQAFVELFVNVKFAPFTTAHSSQGGEHEIVVIDLGDLMRIKDPFVLNKAMYVAFSRAKQELIFMI